MPERSPTLSEEGLERQILDQKRIERELFEIHTQKDIILNAISANIVFVNQDLQILWANEAAVASTGKSLEQIAGKKCHVFWGTPESPCEHCPVLKVFETKKTERTVRTTPTGRIFDLRAEPIFDGARSLIGFLEIADDITDKAAAQKALAKSQEKFSMAFRSSPAATVITTLEEGRYIDVNDSFLTMSGYRYEDVIGKTSLELNRWVSLAQRERLYQALREKGSVRNFEYRFRKRSGQMGTGLLSAEVIDIHGEPCVLALIIDITRERGSEEALRKSEEKYRKILETIQEAYYEVDIAGNFTFFNDSLCRITGYPREELMGMNNRDHMEKENAKRLFEEANKVFTTGKPSKAYEYEIIQKDGSRRYIETSISLMKNSMKRPVGLRGIVRDVTERRQFMKALEARERELEAKTANLQEMNTALKVLLDKREEDRWELEKRILYNVKEMAQPYVDKLKEELSDERLQSYVNILESNLEDIVSPLSWKLTAKNLNLTPQELQVANLIRRGKSTKHISRLMGLSIRTVEFHRKNIRKKMGLVNRNKSLRSHLLKL